jgi:hypothetical protein
MPVTTSTRAVGAKVVMVQLEVTPSTGAGITTAQRIVARRSSHRAPEP